MAEFRLWPVKNNYKTMPEDKKDKKQTKEKSEFEDCKKKMEEYLDGWKRAKADYLNLKKEFEKEKEDIIKFANAELVLNLLPIFDNFKRAFENVPEEQKDSEWLKGVENIKKQFEDFLRDLHIEEIKTVGEKFDPRFHEAVSQREEEEKEEDIVLEEVSSGYKMHEKVIIPAKVIVSK